ncbi:MAG: endolytic transglycosylase MltG [Bryobacteraceae bacterium]
MGRRRVNVLLLMVLTVFAAGGIAWLTLFEMHGPASGRVLVDVPRGASTRRIGELLAEAGVLRSRWQFVAVRLLRPRTRLQAGEYAFSKPDTPWHIFERLSTGDVYYYELMVPEGANLFDIGASLERLGLMKKEDFLETARNPAVVKELLAGLAPDAPSLEGFLFPATYRLTRSTPADKLARDMVAQFRKVYASLGGQTPALQTATLASLVEKESAVPAERPVVASVYVNRVTRKMKLDCDPTTIYAALLENRWRGTIYRSDLESTNPYNTYRNPGFPPGPIANPGRRALEAAMHPADTPYLYFVAKADGSGGHNFSEDLAHHQTAVAQYRRGHEKTVTPKPASAAPGRARPHAGK